jgi:hypothetical protein
LLFATCLETLEDFPCENLKRVPLKGLKFKFLELFPNLTVLPTLKIPEKLKSKVDFEKWKSVSLNVKLTDFWNIKGSDFLVNEIVDTKKEPTEPSPCGHILKSLLPCGKVGQLILSFYCQEGNLTPDLMNWLTSLSNLSSLTLNFVESDFQSILKLTQLSHLDISTVKNQLEDLSAISNLRNLSILKLDVENMYSRLKTLVLPPTLLELKLRNLNITFISPQWTTLERLYLSICNTTTELEHLNPLTRLTFLTLERKTPTDDEEYDSKFKMVELPQIIRFEVYGFSRRSMDQLFFFVPNCQRLQIFDQIIDDRLQQDHEWKGLGSLTKVTKLSISYFTISDSVFEKVKNFPLRTLKLLDVGLCPSFTFSPWASTLKSFSAERGNFGEGLLSLSLQ